MVKKLFLAVLGALVALNLFVIAAALVARRRLPAYGDAGSETFAVVAAMDGVSFRSSADPFLGGTATAVAGGIELDLTEAVPTGTVTLELTALAGGIDVVVPSAWRVEVRSAVIMGGVENRTDPDSARQDAPILVVDARVTMGGISIRTGAPAAQAIRSGAE